MIELISFVLITTTTVAILFVIGDAIRRRRKFRRNLYKADKRMKKWRKEHE